MPKAIKKEVVRDAINNQDRARTASLIRREFQARKDSLKERLSSDEFEKKLEQLKAELKINHNFKQLEKLKQKAEDYENELIKILLQHPKFKGLGLNPGYRDPDTVLRMALDKLLRVSLPTLSDIDKEERRALAMIEKSRTRVHLELVLNQHVMTQGPTPRA